MDLNKLEAYAKHGDMGPYSAQFVELIALIRKQEEALAVEKSWAIADPSGVVDRLIEAAQKLLDESCKVVAQGETGPMADAMGALDDALAGCVGWPVVAPATTQEIRAVANSHEFGGDVMADNKQAVTVDTPEFQKLHGQLLSGREYYQSDDAETVRRDWSALIAHIDAHVAAQVAEAVESIDLNGIEQYRMQMAGISTAALGYWTEADTVAPEYDTPALRDVAKLYAKYAALSAQAVAPVADSGNDVPVWNVLNSKRQAWECKIGVVAGVEIPRGGDAPMRRAVEKAFFELTGQEPDANFSGWGTTFNSAELAVINHQSGGGKQ